MAKDKDVPTAAQSVEAIEMGPEYLRHGELFYMVHELSRLISTYFDHAMGQYQLTRAQWWGMMHVSEHEGATQTELAAIMQMGRASAGKLLERLEAKGWIERHPDANDSRVRRVFLTATATDVNVAMNKEGGNLFRDFLTGISSEEQTAMLVGMRKMKANGEKREGKK